MKKSTYVSDLSDDEKLMMAILRAAEGFRRGQSEACRICGLSFPQYNVLRVLEASEGGRNMVSGVSKIMLVPVANMTGLSKGLEKEGFITRSFSLDDERIKILQITEKGREALKKIVTGKDRHISEALNGLTNKEKNSMLNNIKLVIKNLKKD